MGKVCQTFVLYQPVHTKPSCGGSTDLPSFTYLLGGSKMLGEGGGSISGMKPRFPYMYTLYEQVLHILK